ncbi:MAG: peptidoglycan-binding protein [Scytonema sp. RU_4_4]|nr:peptidoglycan-binding protein [Scytonema sp. RU_4_4]NJR73041.1 peptidoglycan-binding protein [Scytonema sp. CRU_2_7]
MSTQTHPTLQKGSKGESVRHLQDLLNQADRKQNFGNPPPLNADGDFGNNTETAVKLFQKYYGLSIDGIAGPKTWAKLEQVVR